MQNWHRWLLTLGLAFLGGVIQCASDSKPQTASDYVRHGLIGMGPAVLALNMSLQKTNGNGNGVKNG